MEVVSFFVFIAMLSREKDFLLLGRAGIKT